MHRTARTIIRSRATVRAAALGVFVVALAAGCSGGQTAGDGDGIDQTDGTTTTQEADGTDDASGASDAGGAGDSEAPSAGEALAEDADLATDQPAVSAEQAIEIAKEAAGGGNLVQIEIDHDDTVWEWEIEIEIEIDGTEHELDIDATTGEITEHETDTTREEDPVVDVTSPMTPSEAIEIALGEVDGRVSGWDLDSDDGRILYTIDIDKADGDDVEVEVDVETGQTRIDD